MKIFNRLLTKLWLASSLHLFGKQFQNPFCVSDHSENTRRLINLLGLRVQSNWNQKLLKLYMFHENCKTTNSAFYSILNEDLVCNTNLHSCWYYFYSKYNTYYTMPPWIDLSLRRLRRNVNTFQEIVNREYCAVTKSAPNLWPSQKPKLSEV